MLPGAARDAAGRGAEAALRRRNARADLGEFQLRGGRRHWEDRGVLLEAGGLVKYGEIIVRIENCGGSY